EVNSLNLPMIDHVLGLDVTKPIALIFGGSRGAPKINQAVVEAYPILRTRGYQIIFIPGEEHYEKIDKQLNEISHLLHNSYLLLSHFFLLILFLYLNLILII